MVSFFGLKLGGDKKKKNEKQVEEPQSFRRIDPPANGGYIGGHGHGGGSFGPGGPGPNNNMMMGRPVLGPGLGNFDRPSTSHSARGSLTVRPYASNAAAASSMVDLSAPPRLFQEEQNKKASVSSLGSLLQAGSEFDIFRNAWAAETSGSGSGGGNDPDEPGMAPPPSPTPWRNRPGSPFRANRPDSLVRNEAPRRAEKSDTLAPPLQQQHQHHHHQHQPPPESPRLGDARSKSPANRQWGETLDGHSGVEPVIKSPLSHLELVPVSPMSPSQEPSPVQGDQQSDYFAKGGYPSPPASVRSGSGSGDAAAPAGSKVRPNVNNLHNPSGLRQVSNAAAPPMGPSSLPSPANSTDRSSEEERQLGGGQWGGAGGVGSNRDTMSSPTFDKSHHHTLSMDIEQTEKSILAEFNFNDSQQTRKASPTRLNEPKQSDLSEFAAFNFGDGDNAAAAARPTTSHGPGPRQERQPDVLGDFSGFNFGDDRPRTSAGPGPAAATITTTSRSRDLPAPLKIQKEVPAPYSNSPQYQVPGSPFLHGGSPMRTPDMAAGWTSDNNSSSSPGRLHPRGVGGDRVLLPTGGGPGPAPTRPLPRLNRHPHQQQPTAPATRPSYEEEAAAQGLEPLEPPPAVGYFGSTGPRSSRASSFFETLGPDSPYLRLLTPSRDSFRAPDDSERAFDPRLRRAADRTADQQQEASSERPVRRPVAAVARTPSPASSVYDSQPNSPGSPPSHQRHYAPVAAAPRVRAASPSSPPQVQAQIQAQVRARQPSPPSAPAPAPAPAMAAPPPAQAQAPLGFLAAGKKSPRPVDITEMRSPLDDLFKASRGDLDLSFSFPGQPPPPSKSTLSPGGPPDNTHRFNNNNNNLVGRPSTAASSPPRSTHQPPTQQPPPTAPRITNQPDRHANWPLVSPTRSASAGATAPSMSPVSHHPQKLTPTSPPPEQLLRPEFANPASSESRSYTPASSSGRGGYGPPLEPPPRSATRTASPMGTRVKAPPLVPPPTQKVRHDAMADRALTPTGVQDNFGTAFI